MIFPVVSDVRLSCCAAAASASGNVRDTVTVYLPLIGERSERRERLAVGDAAIARCDDDTADARRRAPVVARIAGDRREPATALHVAERSRGLAIDHVQRGIDLPDLLRHRIAVVGDDLVGAQLLQEVALRGVARPRRPSPRAPSQPAPPRNPIRRPRR